ncbi:transcriptional regulator GcvA [Neoaquamicrobium sediminum]|uniref:Transcriptional regulator GcvA n=1 Tax=Neoaquamicrobium sediminum TaxID=1849104 RepID=A0ABV3WNE8_9HYPH
MYRNLPPLSAVRVFEAAARHGSFTRAADELGMTQAAVSYQIKALEERVGAPLFLRRPRQVELTETGLRLAAASTQALDVLSAAFGTMRDDVAGKLTISTVPTLATNWLAPRLGLFQLANPSIAVRLETSPRYVDFSREDVDVAIRVGTGNWPGLVAHPLLPTIFTPMLSPELAASIGGINEPADLLRLPILTPTDPWWAQWLTAAGVSPEGLKGRPQNEMGSQANEARAAIAGQGVAILTPFFFTSELASGRLIQPFDLLWEDKACFWLVYPQGRRNLPKISAFRSWILAEAAASQSD